MRSIEGKLISSRITLEPFNDALLTPTYVAWLNDPEVTRFSEQRHRKHTLESCGEYAAAMARSTGYFWGIICHDPPLGHIGNLSAYVDPNNGTADIAIMIGDSRARGRGLGREAWVLACTFLLGAAKLRKVTAGTMASNRPMRRIFESIGMQTEGVRRGQLLLDGKPEDVVLVGLFPGDLKPQ